MRAGISSRLFNYIVAFIVTLFFVLIFRDNFSVAVSTLIFGYFSFFLVFTLVDKEEEKAEAIYDKLRFEIRNMLKHNVYNYASLVLVILSIYFLFFLSSNFFNLSYGYFLYICWFLNIIAQIFVERFANKNLQKGIFIKFLSQNFELDENTILNIVAEFDTKNYLKAMQIPESLNHINKEDLFGAFELLEHIEKVITDEVGTFKHIRAL